jgi:hypothetical protein
MPLIATLLTIVSAAGAAARAGQPGKAAGHAHRRAAPAIGAAVPAGLKGTRPVRQAPAGAAVGTPAHDPRTDVRAAA